jgi:hypothetical protein
MMLSNTHLSNVEIAAKYSFAGGLWLILSPLHYAPTVSPGPAPGGAALTPATSMCVSSCMYTCSHVHVRCVALRSRRSRAASKRSSRHSSRRSGRRRRHSRVPALDMDNSAYLHMRVEAAAARAARNVWAENAQVAGRMQKLGGKGAGGGVCLCVCVCTPSVGSRRWAGGGSSLCGGAGCRVVMIYPRSRTDYNFPEFSMAGLCFIPDLLYLPCSTWRSWRLPGLPCVRSGPPGTPTGRPPGSCSSRSWRAHSAWR